jgi:hypothetical protein
LFNTRLTLREPGPEGLLATSFKHLSNFGFMTVSVLRRPPLVLTLLALVIPGFPSGLSSVAEPLSPATTPDLKLQYGIEWRLIRAGNAVLQFDPGQNTLRTAKLNLLSTGLVSKLFPVDDRYVSNYFGNGCIADVWLQAQEGLRKRETKITYDRAAHRANYLEKDLNKDQVLLSTQLTVPECTYDVIGALQELRIRKIDPGHSVQLPVSDGKRIVSARIDAQEREQMKTPSGIYRTVRYEAFLFNNVLYQRKGRLFIWLTDDERRVPVQIKVQLQLHIGTVTLQLEKEERS